MHSLPLGLCRPLGRFIPPGPALLAPAEDRPVAGRVPEREADGARRHRHGLVERIVRTVWARIMKMPISPVFAGMIGDLATKLEEQAIPAGIDQLYAAGELNVVQTAAWG